MDRAIVRGQISPKDKVAGSMIEQSFAIINAFPVALRSQYHIIGATAVAYVWRVMAGLCAFAVLTSLFMRNLKIEGDSEVALTDEEPLISEEAILFSNRETSLEEQKDRKRKKTTHDAPDAPEDRSSVEGDDIYENLLRAERVHFI